MAAWGLIERHWARATIFAASALPAFAWFAYINTRTLPNPAELLSPAPFSGILMRMATPVHYPFGFAMNAVATGLDYAALAGIAAAVVYCARYFRRLLKEPYGLVAFAFVALVAFVSTPAAWTEAYAFARGYSPLILLVALDGFRARSIAGAWPLALTAPRIGLQVGGQVLGIARGLTGL
jgi:multidrug transporter EmrE-like cation transporter